MTGKIKLNAASGGGSVSFQAPSSTGDDRIITLPTTADGTVLTTTNPKAGNIIQVVYSNQSDFSTTSTNTFVDVTSATLNITPSSSSNKIMVMFSCYIATNLVSGNNVRANIKMLRDSTELFLSLHAAGDSSGGLQTKQTCTQIAIDEPGDTSTHTYKIQACNTNTSSTPSIGINDARLVAMEVAG